MNGSDKPEMVRLEELGSPNGTANVHLTVTDFKFGKHIVTFLQNGDRGRVWIPLLTKEDQWTKRPVVVHSKEIKDDVQLQDILNRTEITGIVSNGIQGLGKNQQKEFAKLYPNDKLRNAIALEIDAKMPSAWKAFPLLALGIVLIAVACYLLYVEYLRPSNSWDRKHCHSGGNAVLQSKEER